MSVIQEAVKTVSFPTSRFGHVSVAEDKVINFIHGIPGFPGLRRFILIDHDEPGFFKWLQSADDPDIAFLLTDPRRYKADYEVRLRKQEIDSLGVKDASSVVTLVMVSVLKETNELGLNLRGPVVFNSENMSALQCILDREDYQYRLIIRL